MSLNGGKQTGLDPGVSTCFKNGLEITSDLLNLSIL
jgi:hypothetical protein